MNGKKGNAGILIILIVFGLLFYYTSLKAKETEEIKNIELTYNGCNPQNLVIGVGTEIIWTNKDNVNLILNIDTKGLVLSPRESFSKTFTEARDVQYTCAGKTASIKVN